MFFAFAEKNRKITVKYFLAGFRSGRNKKNKNNLKFLVNHFKYKGKNS